MIKAVGIHQGKPMLVLGLSEGNLRLLEAGKPIMFDGHPFGYEGKVLIFSGRTNEQMIKTLKTHGNCEGAETHTDPDGIV